MGEELLEEELDEESEDKSKTDSKKEKIELDFNMDASGRLAKEIEFTDSGVRLEGYKVPSFDKAIELVKYSHMQLPYFNLIGWDIAIEEDGSPIMIELNLNPDLSQSANGPAFGDYTETILKDAQSRNNTWTPVTNVCMSKRNYKIIDDL